LWVSSYIHLIANKLLELAFILPGALKPVEFEFFNLTIGLSTDFPGGMNDNRPSSKKRRLARGAKTTPTRPPPDLKGR
jgi:hypothetical protein